MFKLSPKCEFVLFLGPWGPPGVFRQINWHPKHFHTVCYAWVGRIHIMYFAVCSSLLLPLPLSIAAIFWEPAVYCVVHLVLSLKDDNMALIDRVQMSDISIQHFVFVGNFQLQYVLWIPKIPLKGVNVQLMNKVLEYERQLYLCLL